MIRPKNQSVTVTVQDGATDNVTPDVSSSSLSNHTTMDKAVYVKEAVEINSLEDALAAIMEILNKYFLCDEDDNIRIIKREEENLTFPNLKPYFRTVEVDHGQVNRLINTKSNGEGVVPLPAVFMHFIDMHWDVGTYQIGTCKTTLRLKIVLNRLDTDTYDGQMHPYRVAQAIINCIHEHRSKYSAFTRKMELDYLDMLESWTKGVQYFWVTYQLHLNDYTTYAYKRYVERHVVVSPFTDHDDQLHENNDFGHENHGDNDFEEHVKYIVPDGSEKIPIHV